MHRYIRAVLYLSCVVVSIVALAACGDSGLLGRGRDEALTASGIIRAREVTVSSEFGGRIAEVPVAAAEVVRAGQLLVRLDTAVLDADIQVAEALLAMAQAGLAQAQAGARPGQIAVAQAQVAQAQAGLLAAQQAVTDTQALVDRPQDINLEIALLQAQLAGARHDEARAAALKGAAEIGKEVFEDVCAQFGGGGRQRFQVASGSLADLIREALPPALWDALPPEIRDNLPGLPAGTYRAGEYELVVDGDVYTLYKWVAINIPLEAHLLPNTWWQAWVGLNAATAQVDGMEAALAHLYAERDAPLAYLVKLDEARGAVAQATAQAALAQIQVGALNAGARAEQIAVLEAQVAQAKSGLSALMQQREMFSLTAPLSGVVIVAEVQPGEVAAAGAPLVTIADLTDLTLTVYVPENRLAEVQLGQIVTATVNSVADRTFSGVVQHIASQAEFTPRNVATQEERVNLVFAVDIQLPNPGGVLKPGMAADVEFLTLEPLPAEGGRR